MKKYRRLKRYWRLLLKYKKELSHTEYKHYRLFGQRLEVNVVQELLDYDHDLKVNYELYQTLLHSIKEKDFKTLSTTLSTVKLHTISNYMKTSVNTLKDRKSTRLNSSHVANSYAVFCLKKKIKKL